MKMVMASKRSLEAIVETRRRSGSGRLDECWEGVWHLTDPSAPHQRVAGRVYRIFSEVVEDSGQGTAWISINVTDRAENWLENHRCPDGAVILKRNPGVWVGESRAAFLGGPDLIIEVLSEDDEVYDKFPFYASLGVKEILIIDPGTCHPELWRLKDRAFEKVAAPLRSAVAGLEFEALPEGLQVTHPATGRRWSIAP
jgi:Uma2 family endonuclease